MTICTLYMKKSYENALAVEFNRPASDIHSPRHSYENASAVEFNRPASGIHSPRQSSVGFPWRHSFSSSLYCHTVQDSALQHAYLQEAQELADLSLARPLHLSIPVG